MKLIDKIRSTWAQCLDVLRGRWEDEIPHDFPVLVRRLLPEEGGGYLACIPQLGSATMVADGATPAEAIRNLRSLWEHMGQEIVVAVHETRTLQGRSSDEPLVIYTEKSISGIMHEGSFQMDSLEVRGRRPYSDVIAIDPHTQEQLLCQPL